VAQRKLLLADDSITIQKVVNLTFADEGIEVITVGDGDSAMEKMTEVEPDLVMADVNMPGLNGYQICEKIRQTENLKKTPVILLVGSFEPFDEEEAKRVGADDFLTKPFQSIRQLVNKVTDLLQGSAQNGESVSEDFQNADTLSSFSAEAQGYNSPEVSPSGTEQYGNAGMDDEMIQASNASGFALDEASKFETKEVDEFEHEDAAKTQPLSPEEVQQFSYGGFQEETETSEVSVYQTPDQASLEEQNISQSQSTTGEVSAPQTARVLAIDEDDDLLEIPFDEDEEDWEEEETSEAATASSASEQPQQESEQTESTVTETTPVQNEMPSFEQSTTSQIETQEETQTSNQGALASTTSSQFSPELIDAIAQRVVEKLSDKAVKDVAWEVVPQMADLIIKKMAEEKLKE
jgi:CheY-like chemotaxis protein